MGEKKVDRFLFKLSDKLGEGSYGQVFKGHDEKSKEVVAIKMLNKALINEDDYLRDGLMNEIKIMRDLTGNNVVRLIDVLETTNNYYIVQEYCDGGDLQHLLKKKKFLPQREAIQFFVDVLLGMMELVKKGIIHRDLKPANILISRGVYKIADFGFSKAVDNFSKQMLTSNVGTPLYQSPQLLKGDKYTSKSDVWSLGFIFYEILYGQTPWTGRSIPELIKNIYKIPLNFPQDKGVDAQFINMLKGCLELEEKGRFGWDQLYRHPCFGTSFKFYTDQTKQLEDKAMFLVQDLRFKVMKDKIDLEKVFTKYDKSGDNSLDMKEFTVLLHEIDPKLEREEIEFIFNKIDLDGSNSIELSEFKKWLEENQVQMSLKKNPPPSFQRRGTQEIVQVKPNESNQEIPDYSGQFDNKKSQRLPQQQQQSAQVQQFYNQQSQQYQGNSPQVNSPQLNQFNQSGSYQQYQPNQYQNPPYPPNQYASNQLPQNQFPPQYPPNQYAPNPYQQQQYPPPNQQFSQQYSQGMPPYQNMQGSQSQQQYPYPNEALNNSQNPYQMYQQPPPYQSSSQQLASERAMITIQKLVIAIEKYNINIMELFRKYDKSDSQSLDVKEFGIMLRKIDNQLTDQDINQAFWLFDKDRSNEISFKEFKDGIEEHVRRWKLLNQQKIYAPQNY